MVPQANVVFDPTEQCKAPHYVNLFDGLPLEPRHGNPMGWAHGGLLVTVADMVMGAGSGHATGEGPTARARPTSRLLGSARPASTSRATCRR